ncbi:hypothetical protein TASIC1_0008011400 [Trichoderma asperellum]|uniref:Uncharacterized protein n=1 Tax=Trichoderma asperellum TaxID=101201 RepID=A0A6V8R3V3_TRIAP|nr:hypothetical protein TASIC1_0008011400 [Trichoderma asperellum]
MAASFSLDEKRFVLAEMIKCSSVDVDMLIRFVESNVSDPNWMIMQIPPGRNLEQCMQVANRSPTAPNHRSAMSQNDHLANSAVPPRLANIAPRPPQPVPGSNTPRPILPAIQRQADTRSSQPPPPAHVPLLLDSPPSKKKRKTSAGAVSVSTPPPPPSVTTPSASVDHEKRPRESSEANSINGRENIREMGQVQSPRPMPLEPEPRHHPTLMPVASAAPSQIKA